MLFKPGHTRSPAIPPECLPGRSPAIERATTSGARGRARATCQLIAAVVRLPRVARLACCDGVRPIGAAARSPRHDVTVRQLRDCELVSAELATEAVLLVDVEPREPDPVLLRAWHCPKRHHRRHLPRHRGRRERAWVPMQRLALGNLSVARRSTLCVCCSPGAHDVRSRQRTELMPPGHGESAAVTRRRAGAATHSAPTRGRTSLPRLRTPRTVPQWAQGDARRIRNGFRRVAICVRTLRARRDGRRYSHRRSRCFHDRRSC